MQSDSESIDRDLQQLQLTDNWQPDRIESNLDLVLLALMAIADLDTKALLQAATNLKLTDTVGDYLGRWQQGTATKPIDEAEAKALTLVICHLAKQHRELIRRAVGLLERSEVEQRDLSQVNLLQDYLNKFVAFYRLKIEFIEPIPTKRNLATLARKLLTDLLFYSGDRGYRRLWLAIC